MLSLPQKAMAGLASALVIGALVPSAANASLFRFGVSGEFDSFGAFPVDDFTSFFRAGSSFSGEIVVDSLPAPDGGSSLVSWEIDLFTQSGSPFPFFTFSSVLPDIGGQNDPSLDDRFVFGSLFGGATQDSFIFESGNFGGSVRRLQLPFAKGFQGDGPILGFASGSSLQNFDNGTSSPPTGVLRITSGFAELISGPTVSDNIDFTFDETVATLNSPPTLVEREAGLSVENLSYSLTAPTTDEQKFSWNATRGISVSWAEPTIASIFGNTTISLDGAASELEFFVKGLLNDDPFDLFTTSLSLADDASQLVQWDLAQIVDLLPGDYTLELTSGVRWLPSAPGSVLTVSSQYGADAAPIPTPALLPGLIGMGVAAFRKRKRQDASLGDSV